MERDLSDSHWNAENDTAAVFELTSTPSSKAMALLIPAGQPDLPFGNEKRQHLKPSGRVGKIMADMALFNQVLGPTVSAQTLEQISVVSTPNADQTS